MLLESTEELLFNQSPFSSIFDEHSKTTLLLVANNAIEGILSSYFYKFADAILKKYSSSMASFLTGILSALLFGQRLPTSFFIAMFIFLISMHQFFSFDGNKKQENKNSNLFQYKPSSNQLTVTELPI